MSGELVKVLERSRKEWQHHAVSMAVLKDIEAAARADHPEDWPPRDGEVRNVRVIEASNGGCDYVYEYAVGGNWSNWSVCVSPSGRTVLRQLAQDGRL